MKKVCRFYITRHGQTEWNKKSILQGHKDSDLTEEGIQQARKAAELLKDVEFDYVYSLIKLKLIIQNGLA